MQPISLQGIIMGFFSNIMAAVTQIAGGQNTEQVIQSVAKSGLFGQAPQQAAGRQPQKQASAGATVSGAQQAGLSSGNQTNLTGTTGVDPNALSLGKNTLLG